MVTTPTPLAETIARVEKETRDAAAHPAACISWPDTRELLRCARRCEALESADGLVAGIRAHRKQFGWANTAVVFSERWAEVVDAAAERDALAKRVGELEGELAYSTNQLGMQKKISRANEGYWKTEQAESARLREELDAAQRREIAAHNSAGELARRCEDAERRVRSTATNRELAAIHELDAAKTANARLRTENERLGWGGSDGEP